MTNTSVKHKNTFKNTRRKRKHRLRKWICFFLCTLILALTMFVMNKIGVFSSLFARHRVNALKEVETPSWIDVQLLDSDGKSRSGWELADINAIVIHYVGNPNTTAQANRNYFNMKETEVSSHFVVGLEGEIIQCLPLYERSVASNNRNKNTISIEVCHPDESGEFNEKTYASLVKLSSWLCDICEFDDKENIIRHYDVVGKLCPLYYVENQDAWVKLQEDILNFN